MPDKAPKVCEWTDGDRTVLIPYEVHRRRGMRHLRVVVSDPACVHLKVPYAVSEARAVAFLQENARWVLEILAKLPEKPDLASWLRERGRVSAWGRAWKLELEVRGGRAGWRIEAEPCVVRAWINPALPEERQLQAVLQGLAREALPERSRELALRHGLPLKRVTVRNQKRRWGACTVRGTVSLNWRLVLLSPELHDHVILHELAHLRHLDHSPAFWEFLRVLDPDCPRNNRALTRVSGSVIGLGT